MTPEEQMPSTHDCAKRVPPGGDAVVLCLVRARNRVKEGHTRKMYATEDPQHPEVCALGAVYVESVTPGDLRMYGNGMRLYRAIEAQLADEAKEAIELLNSAAVDLYPESDEGNGWAGPLEWINQEMFKGDEDRCECGDEDCCDCEDSGVLEANADTKRVVLEVYDHAIASRLAAV